jgi:sulfur relay protein TusB/DsrH
MKKMSKILFFLTCECKLGIDLSLEHNIKTDEITICLLQNAVYHANKTNEALSESINKITVYAGKEDVTKRGIKNHLLPEVKLLDYGEIIDLVLEHDNIVNL